MEHVFFFYCLINVILQLHDVKGTYYFYCQHPNAFKIIFICNMYMLGGDRNKIKQSEENFPVAVR
jgi:hypothetical protein